MLQVNTTFLSGVVNERNKTRILNNVELTNRDIQLFMEIIFQPFESSYQHVILTFVQSKLFLKQNKLV